MATREHIHIHEVSNVWWEWGCVDECDVDHSWKGKKVQFKKTTLCDKQSGGMTIIISINRALTSAHSKEGQRQSEWACVWRVLKVCASCDSVQLIGESVCVRGQPSRIRKRKRKKGKNEGRRRATLHHLPTVKLLRYVQSPIYIYIYAYTSVQLCVCILCVSCQYMCVCTACTCAMYGCYECMHLSSLLQWRSSKQATSRIHFIGHTHTYQQCRKWVLCVFPLSPSVYSSLSPKVQVCITHQPSVAWTSRRTELLTRKQEEWQWIHPTHDWKHLLEWNGC